MVLSGSVTSPHFIRLTASSISVALTGEITLNGGNACGSEEEAKSSVEIYSKYHPHLFVPAG